ncbi:flagellar motor switch protein FliG [Desulfohalobium retbaense DSM 5692]|uniref:Flagellar motor switch protein FliG n=2 Tax=Desulfohalobium TaxID=45662 RepID=C8WYV1_DESRD|nr:flagellar motor switch protein FliG [Desulfohalobium retbaense DSM 5692]
MATKRMSKRDFDNLSGVEKTAVLLLCLGEKTTAEVFKELSDTEVRLISRSMMQIDHVPADMARKVLDRYKESMQEYAGFFVDGGDFMQKAIYGTGDPERVDGLLEEVMLGSEDRPLETIAMMDPRTIASLLENEHPQTIALILSTQKADQTGAILSFFSEMMRADVVYRIAKIDKVSPDVLSHIEEALQREIGGVVNKEQQQVGGVDKVVDILSQIDKGGDFKILEKIESQDPDMAEEIRKKMFTFEDLESIDNRGMQLILREVRNETLTLALKTASPRIQDKIYNNISERAKEMIQDDLESMGPVRLSEVESAQQSIVQQALRLEEEGRLVIPGRGGQEVLV